MMLKKSTAQPVEVDPTTLAPHTAAEFSARGWLFYGRQQYEKAIADFREALDQEANDPDTLFALGLTLAAAGQAPQAIQVFGQALQSLDSMEDKVRARMLTRLIKGHISRIETGDWHLTH